MKFISKSSNYMLVLKPGIPGSSVTGQASQPGIYVRFRDGIVEVKDQDMIDRMKTSDGFRNGDFIGVDDHGEDPFADTRTPSEPAHIISEIKYGHVEGRKMTEVPVKLPASAKKLIEREAVKMAKAMLPDLLKEAIREMTAAAASNEASAKKVTKATPAAPVESDLTESAA